VVKAFVDSLVSEVSRQRTWFLGRRDFVAATGLSGPRILSLWECLAPHTFAVLHRLHDLAHKLRYHPLLPAVHAELELLHLLRTIRFHQSRGVSGDRLNVGVKRFQVGCPGRMLGEVLQLGTELPAETFRRPRQLVYFRFLVPFTDMQMEFLHGVPPLPGGIVAGPHRGRDLQKVAVAHIDPCHYCGSIFEISDEFWVWFQRFGTYLHEHIPLVLAVQDGRMTCA
jgi:hypothetical protein